MNLANLYTKTGDKGETSLVGGSRVRKDCPRVNCYGTMDEVNAVLGVAYTLTKNEYIRDCIDKVQRNLFRVGAELASDEKGMEILGGNVVGEKDVEELEGMVDRCTLTTGVQTEFVIPGVNTASAVLHVARTIVRRGERAIIALEEEITVRDVLLRYVNRLSDAIYALARLEETICLPEYGKNKNRCWPPR